MDRQRSIPPSVTVNWPDVFGSVHDSTDAYLSITEWDSPVLFFVGRNGSGKSRAARAIASSTGAHMLSTDRLLGLMQVNFTGYASVPATDQYKGVPIGVAERAQAKNISQQQGLAIDELYALREQPDVWLRVAAFIRRALGRVIELRENAGFIDPYVRIGDVEYSLLREEGHGLRELVVLLSATYRDDLDLLIFDEPELHLHPSMARMWLAELEATCRASGRRAIVVTHDPNLLRPQSFNELGSIWHFQQGRAPIRVVSTVLDQQRDRVTASLQQNPILLSQLVFSPRPVLVEGDHDIAALSVVLARRKPPEVVMQTDLVECGGYGGVALWFEIAGKLGLDVRAIADLDALWASECQRAMDANGNVIADYRNRMGAEPPRTSEVLRRLRDRMASEGVASDPASRRDWLASLGQEAEDGHAFHRDLVLQIWRDAGLWLHPQGTLEDVLGLNSKGSEKAREAAMVESPLDEVADWCAFSLDPSGDVALLLGAAVEAIAHRLQEAQRLQPGAKFNVPVGASAESDARLVSVKPVDNGLHQLTVIAPAEFAGWWLQFDRSTSPEQLILRSPDESPAAR